MVVEPVEVLLAMVCCVLLGACDQRSLGDGVLARLNAARSLLADLVPAHIAANLEEEEMQRMVPDASRRGSGSLELSSARRQGSAGARLSSAASAAAAAAAPGGSASAAAAAAATAAAASVGSFAFPRRPAAPSMLRRMSMSVCPAAGAPPPKQCSSVPVIPSPL